jgi:hypothetical protein
MLISPYGESLLLVGAPGSGRSTLATNLLERLAGRGYTFCVIDVEGDYGTIAKAVSLGSPSRPPAADEILKLLRRADQSGVINLVGLPVAERLTFLTTFTPRLAELRETSGHPHWVVVDETHHLLPAGRASGDLLPLGNGQSVLHITVRPSLVAPEVLRSTTLLVAIGPTAQSLVAEFCRASGVAPPPLDSLHPGPGEALVWRPGVASAQAANARPLRLNIATSAVPVS